MISLNIQTVMFLCNMFKTILEAFTTTGDFDDEIRLIYCKLIAKTEDVPVPQETVPQLGGCRSPEDQLLLSKDKHK